MKTYPTAIEDQIDSGNLRIGYILKLNFDTPITITSAGFDVDADGDTFISTGLFQGMESLTRSASFSVTEIQLSFSLSQTTIAQITQVSEHYKRKVEISRVYFSDENGVLYVEKIWQGRVSNYSDSDSENLVNINVKNIWADFEKVNSWRTTLVNHLSRYPTDRCFKYAVKAAETIFWAGTASGNNGSNNSSNQAWRER